MLRSATLEHYLNTVWCIVDSQYVSAYMIGYTRRPSRMRLGEYSKIHGYQYMVVLADGLSLEDAHTLERHLQTSIWTSKKSAVLYRKYDPDRRDGRYFKSAGPTSSIGEGTKHAVYLAWWDKHTT